MRHRLAVAAALGVAATLLASAPARARKPNLGPKIKVRWTFPASGLTAVYTDEVRVRFNRAVDPSSVNTSTVRLLAGTQPVAGTVALEPGDRPREAVFTPDQPLFRGAPYLIEVTTGVRSRKGRPLSREFRGGFLTSPFKDGVRPVLGQDFGAGPALRFGRAFHTADAYPGGIVFAGGQTLDGTPIAATEVMVGNLLHRAQDLGTARRKHASATLADGRVLVCGGFGPAGTTLAGAEVFDPTQETWTPLPPMLEDRANHTATLLADGRVLVAGGFTNRTGTLDYVGGAELYNPYQQAWTSLPALVLPRGGHTATRLQDGRILLAGGGRNQQVHAELYLPAEGTFRVTAHSPPDYRVFHAAALTRTGTVLLAGGGPGLAEEFDVATETFLPAGSAAPQRLGVSDSPYYGSLVRLDERLMFLGGLSVGGGPGGSDLVLDSLRLWTASGLAASGSFYEMPLTLAVPRAGHTITPRPDGSWLLAGGLSTDGLANEARTTIFLPSR